MAAGEIYNNLSDDDVENVCSTTAVYADDTRMIQSNTDLLLVYSGTMSTLLMVDIWLFQVSTIL